jgi:hypothetical protein
MVRTKPTIKIPELYHSPLALWLQRLPENGHAASPARHHATCHFYIYNGYDQHDSTDALTALNSTFGPSDRFFVNVITDRKAAAICADACSVWLVIVASLVPFTEPPRT